MMQPPSVIRKCEGTAKGKWRPDREDRFWREADIPTNGIKAVATEPPTVPTSSPIVVLPESLRTSLASIVVHCVHHAVGGDPR